MSNILFDESNTGAEEALTSKLEAAFVAETGLSATPPEPEQAVEVEAAEEVEQAEDEPQATSLAADEEPEAPPEDTPEDRARNEKGQFVSNEETEAISWARERYGEDLSPKVARALFEKEQFIQRQGTDVGELRKELAQLVAEQRAPAPAPAAPATPALPRNFEDLLEDDPAAATEAAWLAGDQQALNEAFSAWNDAAPGAPRMWAENKQMQNELRDLRDSVGSQASQTVYAEFSRTHPDVDQYTESMVEIARSYPHLTRVLEGSDTAAKVEVLDFLYTKASGQAQARNADTLAKAQENADSEREALVRQQKENAAVASPTKAAKPRRPLNEGQQMLQSIRDTYEDPTDIASGITTD